MVCRPARKSGAQSASAELSICTDARPRGLPETGAMESPSTAAKNTNAFFAQSALAFGTAMLTMLVAIFYLPADPWPKAFLALGTLFLTTSAFSLAKCVRDAQENQYVVSRIDQARVDRILAEHDPWKEIA